MTIPTPEERAAFAARPRPTSATTIPSPTEEIVEIDADSALDNLESALRALHHATEATRRALRQVDETATPADIHRAWLASHRLQRHADALVTEHGTNLIKATKAILAID